MAGATFVDYVVDLDVIENNPILAVKNTKKLAYFCAPKADTEPTFVEITSKEDIANYTDDVFVSKFFDYGISSIFLLTYDGTDPDTSAPYIIPYDDVNAKAFSIFKSPSSTSTDEFNEFNGIRYFYIIEPTEDTDTKVLMDRNCYILDKDAGNFSIALISMMLSQNVWTSLQYAEFSGFTSYTTTNSVASGLREKHYTFLYSDTSTQTTPCLSYFQAGAKSIKEYYIFADAKVDEQTAIANYVKANKPPYTNGSISGIRSAAEATLQTYIDNGYLDSSSYVTIKSKENQLPDDIQAGLVEGVEFHNVGVQDIWYLSGEIIETF